MTAVPQWQVRLDKEADPSRVLLLSFNGALLVTSIVATVKVSQTPPKFLTPTTEGLVGTALVSASLEEVLRSFRLLRGASVFRQRLAAAGGLEQLDEAQARQLLSAQARWAARLHFVESSLSFVAGASAMAWCLVEGNSEAMRSFRGELIGLGVLTGLGTAALLIFESRTEDEIAFDELEQKNRPGIESAHWRFAPAVWSTPLGVAAGGGVSAIW